MTATDSPNTMTIPPKKAYAASITVHLTFQEAPVDINFVDADIAAIERIITSTLGRPGWKPVKPATMGGFGPRKPQTPPWYDDDGTACCPHHHVPLRDKPFGQACPKRLEAGDQHANERGYCKYVYREGK
jgi:hypothetical protein